MLKEATRTLQCFQTTLGFTTGMISKVHVSHQEDLYKQTLKIQLIKAQTKTTQWKDPCECVKELAPAYSMLSSWVIPVTPLGENQHKTTHRISPPQPSALLYRMESWYKFILFKQNSLQLNSSGLLYYLEWNITENTCQSEYIFWNTVYEHLHLHKQLRSKQTPGRLSSVFQHVIQYVELWLTLKDWTTTAELSGDPG